MRRGSVVHHRAHASPLVTQVLTRKSTPCRSATLRTPPRLAA
jgi:hypothetical protein